MASRLWRNPKCDTNTKWDGWVNGSPLCLWLLKELGIDWTCRWSMIANGYDLHQSEPCVQTNGGWPTFLHKRRKKLTIAWNRQFWSLRAIQSLAQSAKPLISVSSLKSGKIESVLVCNPAKSTTRRHSNPDCPFLRPRFAERLFVFPCGQCCYHFT